jgi:hypothetical protein
MRGWRWIPIHLPFSPSSMILTILQTFHLSPIFTIWALVSYHPLLTVCMLMYTSSRLPECVVTFFHSVGTAGTDVGIGIPSMDFRDNMFFLKHLYLPKLNLFPHEEVIGGFAFARIVTIQRRTKYAAHPVSDFHRAPRRLTCLRHTDSWWCATD